MSAKLYARLLLGTVLLAASGVGVFSGERPALALGSNSYWDSWGNCNNWIPHGWSQTWYSNYSSSNGANVTGNLDWQDSGGTWHVEKSAYDVAYGATVTVTADNYWGVTARGWWAEVASHGGTMSPLTGSGQTSQKNIWCG